MIDSNLVQFLKEAGTAAQSRVHTSDIPQNGDLPAIVIRSLGGTPPKTLRGRKLFGRAIFMIVCVGRSAEVARPIADQIKARLDVLPGLMGTTSVKFCRRLSGPNDISASDGDLKLSAFAQEYSFMYQELDS